MSNWAKLQLVSKISVLFDGEVMDDHSVDPFLVSSVNIKTFSCFTG